MDENQDLITSMNRKTNSYATQWYLTPVSATMFKGVPMGLNPGAVSVVGFFTGGGSPLPGFSPFGSMRRLHRLIHLTAYRGYVVVVPS